MVKKNKKTSLSHWVIQCDVDHTNSKDSKAEHTPVFDFVVKLLVS